MAHAGGRPPKPTYLKVLEGNPGKRPLNENEPKPKPSAPKCPAWLSPVAKKEWKRIAPELERLGLLSVIDGAALEGYCESYAKWVELTQFLKKFEKQGYMFKTPSGYMQQLPQVSMAQRYLALVKAFCSEFGLTPSSRSRMTLPGQAEAEDPMEARLRKRGG